MNGCRKEVGDDYPILIKISAYDNMKNGLKLEESIIMAQMMAEMGFDGIEVSCGIPEDGGSAVRGDMPNIEVVLEEWPMYKIKGSFYKFITQLSGLGGDHEK